MGYLALYRKFRPQVFSDVKGQDHIVRTLENQLKTDRIGHAYLFTGTRGTGKTTVAKIFAKAVNCEHRDEEGNPCNECPSCTSITDGNSMDVLELDAASNNGVDNIREIISGMEYPPSQGKYKVYIIDEVHMLSSGAFNALLKSLEEPPSYVIFILATTEVNKIPQTILSRCQRYEFHRISIDTIAARLTELTEKEGVQAEEKAIRYIAKAADGSMRDALSLLDQCIAFYLGQTLTYDNVLSVLGAVDTAEFSRLFRSVRGGNITDALSVIDNVLLEGRELTQFVNDFVWYLRNLLLVKGGETNEEVLGMSSDNMAVLKEETDMVESPVILRYIRVMSALSDRLRFATQKRVLTEVAIIKLCKPEMEKDYDSLVDRVGKIETEIATGLVPAAPAGANAMSQAAGGTASAVPAPVKRHKLPDAAPEDIQKLIDNWNQALSLISGLFKAALKQGTPTLDDDGCLLIVFDAENSVAYNQLVEPENQKRVEGAFSQAVGKEIPVKLKLMESGHKAADEYEDLIQKFGRSVGMEVTVEDFGDE